MDKDIFTPILYKTLGYEGGVNENEVGGGISNAGIRQETYDSYALQKKIEQIVVSKTIGNDKPNEPTSYISTTVVPSSTSS